MPELPEVETVRSGLEQIIGRQAHIQKVEVRRFDLRFPVPPKLAGSLKGLPITAIKRRAKYLLFETPDGVFLNHLGMTGTWREAPVGDERRHDHIYIYLQSGLRLAFNDPRRFGYVDWLPHNKVVSSRWLGHLGPEPLDAKAFSGTYLKNKSMGRTGAVKNFIMDQAVVVGVGNIYASEALYRAGVRPAVAAGKVSKSRYDSLAKAITHVLKNAIKCGGTTLRDFRQAGGSEGYFQNKLAVYGRQGEPCQQCKTPIRKTTQSGRSSYWCPQCQS
ncbi:MAG: bifunctional DNA-formamidopyrimidine glycosylase/DNA-(apurinic or apyrimidinic site) lyase [Pseudobdellovibrionaceae bacterium]|nr:bifunctional DNA-formamidopyrimidine glycosylase/DNA-(apurinic or apyrimidinic site) lyase [Bdellovibrionales bacterium]USN48490.1 MAG: bifunctional DNA-formamidopyrimidine glycosylase/DNA-(apurinic or apyrimidinic site) lyase [Pseudobdellovibrionaceae bacterium]